MEENYTLTDSISLHQQKSEWLLAGAAFLDVDFVRQSCGWLDAAMITNEKIRAFWQDVKNGKEPAEAAVDAQIYTEVLRGMVQINSYYDAPAFAKAIADDNFLRNSAVGLSEIAKAVAARDVESIRASAREIFENAPVTGDEIPTAAEIGLLFESTLGDPKNAIIPTGITTLDAKMGGLDKRTLTIIGGRPGMGKTTAGLQIAVTNAQAGRKAIYFSAEMSSQDLWQRLACGRSEVDWRKIKSETATQAELERVSQANTELINELDNRLLIDDSAMITSADIYRRVAQYRPDVIVVDHLDLVDRHERGKVNEVIRLGNTSRMGKIIAKQFGIASIYLMQLNRGTEQRDNKRPQLSDIRGSGEIEQDADIVMFLYRPDYYAEEESKDTVVSAEIWLEKVRNGTAHVCAKTMMNLKKQWFYPVENRGY